MNSPQGTHKRPVPLSAILPLLLMSALSFTVGMLILTDSTYLSPGYTTVTDQRISASGFQIWDLQDLFLLLLIGLLPAIALLLLWQPLFKRIPGHGLAIGLCSITMLLSVFFLPGPWEFQLRYYSSPAQGFTLHRAYSAQGLAGIVRAKKFETFYDSGRGTSKTFVCHSTTRAQFGAMRYSSHFYPNLDRDNHLKLLETHCES